MHLPPGQLYIKTGDELEKFCAAVRAAKLMALDTEFIRERTYSPRVCLVQVATRDCVALIDPIGLDLRPLWALVTDGDIEKVVNAGEQDFEICHLSSGKPPRNVMDVQVAAGFCGLPYPLSYCKLVQRLLNVELHLDQSYSDWDRRPLSATQLRYAAEDVLYLLPLRDVLRAQLEASGRGGWFAEEMSIYEGDQFYRHQTADAFRKVKGHRELMPRQLAVVNELANWREQAASERDMPPRTLAPDECLVEITRKLPRSLASLRGLRGAARIEAERYGQDLLDALRRGLAIPEEALPRQEIAEERGEEDFILDIVIAVGTALCAAGRMSDPLFASRRDYAALVRAARAGAAAAADAGATSAAASEGVKLLSGWRRMFGGEELLAVLDGRRTLQVVDFPQAAALRIVPAAT